jgi:7-cyano-7-deazaguanosine (preQ0) biosynthesis protein QueE
MGKVPTLAVNEIFGPTFQGEGVNLGMPCMFLRLAGCNLACSWCDTPYTWDWQRFDIKQESHTTPVEDVYQVLSAAPVKNLVISGGEPMLQQKNLYELTKRLHADGWHTEIETAGTVKPFTTELVKHFTVSPKLSNSGNDKKKRYNPEALSTLNLASHRCFKFVVSTLQDFDEIDGMVNDLRLSPVYIMPEGIHHDTITERLQAIASAAIERGYYLTTRLHVTVYGNKRGV